MVTHRGLFDYHPTSRFWYIYLRCRRQIFKRLTVSGANPTDAVNRVDARPEKRSRAAAGDAPNFSAGIPRHRYPFHFRSINHQQSSTMASDNDKETAEEGESINRDVLGLRLAMGNGTADTDTEDTEVQKDEIELAF